MKILRSGLVLTIKSDGNSNFSIRYPLRKTDEGPRQEGFSPEQGPRDSEERVKADIQKQDEFELLDEKDNPVSSYYISNATDIKPQIQYQSGQLIYQVQIPLGRKVDKYMNISINPGSALAVKAATPEMKRPVGRSGGRGGEGAPSDGEGDGMPGGGMGGGGMHGGGRGGRGHGGPGGAGMANAGRDMTPIDLEFSVQLQNGATK
jgi:hypothetical protein